MAGLHMSANSPMTWEIVYTVMCGLAYVKLVVMTVITMAVVAMAVDDRCLLLFT